MTTTTITYDTANINDIDAIMAIELVDFPLPHEASSRQSMVKRIKRNDQTFIVARNDKDQVVGYVCGSTSANRHLSDHLFETIRDSKPSDKYQIITSLAIHPHYQGYGIGTALLDRLEEVAKSQNRIAISLTCLEELINYYEAHGFKYEGPSKSRLAGQEWFNMVKEF